jgi:hypothetical protein
MFGKDTSTLSSIAVEYIQHSQLLGFSALVLLLLFPNFRFRNSNLHFVPFESCGADAFEFNDMTLMVGLYEAPNLISSCSNRLVDAITPNYKHLKDFVDRGWWIIVHDEMDLLVRNFNTER